MEVKTSSLRSKSVLYLYDTSCICKFLQLETSVLLVAAHSILANYYHLHFLRCDDSEYQHQAEETGYKEHVRTEAL